MLNNIEGGIGVGITKLRCNYGWVGSVGCTIINAVDHRQVPRNTKELREELCLLVLVTDEPSLACKIY